MKSTKTFNNLSAKTLALIPKLKPDEKVIFQMLNGVPNPEPDEKERSRNPILFGKMQIPTNYRVYDQYQKDEAGQETGGMVDVGCVDIWNGDRPEKFRRLVPGESGGSQFQGKFELSGGNLKDVELYEVLYLHPQREGSPCRDESTEALFKIVNAKTDSQKLINKVDILRKALDILKIISEQDQREVMAALNQPTYQDPQVLKGQVSEIAKNTPEEFIAAFERKDRSVFYAVKEAFDMNLLSYDPATGQTNLGTTKVATLAVNDLPGFVTNFVSYLQSAKNGSELTENIKTQVSKKQTKEEPGA